MTPVDRLDLAAAGRGRSTGDRFRRAVALGSAGAAVIAVAALLGRVPGLRIPGGIRSDNIPMTPSTAACLLILSVVLFFHASKSWPDAGWLAMVALAVLATALGTLGTIPIGRMPPGTGVAFLLTGVGTVLLLLRSWSPRHARRTGHWASSLGVLTMLAGASVLLAYGYGTPLAYGNTTVSMAATTAGAFMCLGTALVAAAGPECFPVRLIIGDSTSAQLSRVFLPLTLAVVLLQGVLFRLETAPSVLNHPLQLAVLVLLVTMITATVVNRVAYSIGTRLEEANRMLRESDELHGNILDRAIVGFWLVGPKGYLLEVNEAYCRMSGYSAQELLTMRISDLDVTQSAEDIIARTEEIMVQGQQGFETRHRRKDGSVYDVEVRVQYRAVRGGLFVVLLQDITERKQAAEARKESERRLREAQEIARVGSYVLDVRGDVWRSSSMLDEIFGIGADYPRSTAGWASIIHPTERESLVAYLGEVFASHERFKREYRIVRVNDGAERWVLGLGRVEYGEDGAPLRMAGTIQDITDRKLATEQLRLSEESLAITLHSIGDAMIATDVAGLITRMNATAESLTGWRLADAIGRPLPEVFCSINAVTRVPATNPVHLVMERGAVVGLTDRNTLLARDGQECQITGSAAPIHDPTGQIVGLVLVFTDVSEEYRVRKALADSAELLERTGSMAQIGGWELDLRTMKRFWSVQTCRILEIDPPVTPMLDQATLRSFYAPEAWPIMQAAMQTAIDSGTPFDLELPMITAKGRAIWVRDQNSAVMEGGKVVKLVGVLHDITARKLAEAAQAELQEQLTQSQKMESIGLLAGGVAHDFNNMLAAILSYAELTMLKLGKGHAVYSHVDAIRTAAQRSANLTRQLLAFARKQTIAPVVLDLNATVDDVLEMLHRMLGEHVKLAWTPGSALWKVKADPMQINQILANLAVNAQAAMGEREALLDISTSNVVLDAAFAGWRPGMKAGEFVHLRFHDNGSGMDAVTLSRIFEPFFTTKAPGEGTGLGLSMVHGIVEQHGGLISVESTPGAGTTFHLYFPRTGTANESAHASAAPEERLHHGSETILLCEDEEGVRAPVVRLLTLLGYTVLPVQGGAEAIALAASYTTPIHLLLTDMIMPGMNGAQLRDALLSLSPSLKVLFMSGYASNIISTEGVLEPGTHFIQKPFTIQALAEAVRGALDGWPVTGRR